MKQTAYTFIDRAAGGLRLRYLLYLPDGYYEKVDQRWPLVLFLHGRGERGADLNVLRQYGVPKHVDRGDDLPFIAISPQCPLSHGVTPEGSRRFQPAGLTGSASNCGDRRMPNISSEPTRLKPTPSKKID